MGKRKSTLWVVLDGIYLQGISYGYGKGEAARLSVRPMRARMAPARQDSGPDDLSQVQEPLLEYPSARAVEKAQWSHSNTRRNPVEQRAHFFASAVAA